MTTAGEIRKNSIKMGARVVGGILILMLIGGVSGVYAGRWGDDLRTPEFRTLQEELKTSGNIERAIKIYTMFVKLDDEDIYAHFELGNAYTFALEYEKAEAEYRRAMNLDPKFGQAYAGLANVYVLTGREVDAQGLYERSIKISRGELTMNVNLWTMVARTGSIEIAIRAYKYRMENRNQLGDSYLGLGIAQAAVQKNSDAIRSFQLALKFNPTLRTAFQQLASMYEILGQHSKALAASENAARLKASEQVSRTLQLAEGR